LAGSNLYFNDTDSWLIIIPVNVPKRASYTAMLLSNVIVYIRGAEFYEDGYREVDIKQINLYDTKSLT